MLPQRTRTLSKINVKAFYDFWVYLIFLLLVFHKNGCFTLEMDIDVCDS
jgi:hypothetical protein